MRTFLLLILSACAGETPGTTAPDDSGTTDPSSDPCNANANPTLEIGLGLTGYEAAEDGATFPLIHGPQGGFHLEIGLFATGISAEEVLSGELHGFVDGVELASAFPRLDLRCVRTGRESYGTLLVYNSTPEFLDGKTTLIQALVTDADGTVVTAEASFVIEDTE